MTSTPAKPGQSRFWLYLPFALLALIALLWSGLWFYVKGRVANGIELALANELQLGRNWACADHRVSGFPFRIEVHCSALKVTSARDNGDYTATTGPLIALGQIYTPGLILVEAKGPLQLKTPDGSVVDAKWNLLSASFKKSGESFERLSAVFTQPAVTISRTGAAPISTSAQSLELHLRPTPSRPAADGAIDAALTAKAAIIPALDQLMSQDRPTDLDLNAMILHATVFQRGLNPETLEGWRQQMGQIELRKITMVKGEARLEASGQVALDDLKRVKGRLESAVTGVDRIAGIRVGGFANLMQGNRPAAPGTTAAPALRPLPAIEWRAGRTWLGPLRLPLPALEPLY
ncbi:MAG: DUF2125 domain-containing protein [Bosea sp. (in: a-proteobacteria)]